MPDKKPTVHLPALFERPGDKVRLPADRQDIIDSKGEVRRVTKRLSFIIDEHRKASKPLGVTLGPDQLHVVIEGLRDHANGGLGTLELGDRDEIESHCLRRLFEELVEEPSSILYTTLTGPDTVRYEAMDSSFWIKSLEHLEKDISSR